MGLIACRETFNASINSKPRITNSCHMMVGCFGFDDGKGVHDGAKTILKQDIKKEHPNMDPRKPQNDVDVVSFCQRW